MARYTRCKDKNLPDYRMPPSDDVCSSYAKVYNSSYDSFGYNSSAFYRLVSQKRQLDRERTEADQALGAALARVERLRRQHQLLEEKARRMFQQEGEVLREQERQEAAAAAPSPPGP